MLYVPYSLNTELSFSYSWRSCQRTVVKRYSDVIGVEVMWIGRNEYSGRPHSLDCKYSTQNVDIRSYGDLERKNRNQDLQKLSSIKKETLLGQSFLG